MGSTRKLLGSLLLSRLSRRRAEFEAQVFEEQMEAEIRKKQQEIQLKRKQRKLEMEMERKEREMELVIAKEALELEAMTRKKQLKMKKLEILERASSRSSICSVDHSETEKAATTKDWLESSRNIFNHSNDDERKPNLYLKSKDNDTTQYFNDDQQYVSKEPWLPAQHPNQKENN